MNSQDQTPEPETDALPVDDTLVPQVIGISYTMQQDDDPTTTATAIQTPDEQQRPISPTQESLKRFLRDKRATMSAIALIVLIFIAIAGPSIYQHTGGTIQSDLSGPLGPQIYHTYDHQE